MRFSPVKFSKIIFPVWNLVWSLAFYYKNNFCQSLLSKSLRIRLFYRKLNSRKRRNLSSVFHGNSPTSATIKGKLDWNQLKQKEAVESFLRGKDVFGVLPTGFGKSLIFQLFVLAKKQSFVNKIDRLNTTPTVRAICTFAIWFSV